MFKDIATPPSVKSFADKDGNRYLPTSISNDSSDVSVLRCLDSELNDSNSGALFSLNAVASLVEEYVNKVKIDLASSNKEAREAIYIHQKEQGSSLEG